MCELLRLHGRAGDTGPEVGRQSSVVNIHTSYTDLIHSSFTTLGT